MGLVPTENPRLCPSGSLTRGARLIGKMLLVLTISRSLQGTDSALISIDDLVSRVQIASISISPDGTRVAYLTTKGLARRNMYEIELRLVATTGDADSVLLDRYYLSPQETFEADTGVVRFTVGEFAWRSDSRELAYTTHGIHGMDLRVRTISSGKERKILRGFPELEITSTTNTQGLLSIETVSPLRSKPGSVSSLPPDLALLIKDGYRFYGPLENPKPRGRSLIQNWTYDWKTLPTRYKSSAAYRGLPEEWQDVEERFPTNRQETITRTSDEHRSPDGNLMAMIEDSDINLQAPDKARRTSRVILRDLRRPLSPPRVVSRFEDAPSFVSILGWSKDGKQFYYLTQGSLFSSITSVTPEGKSREIYKEQAGLVAPSSGSEITPDARTLVLVRNTNTSPDELLKIDLRTGGATVLDSPNRRFGIKSPADVRFMRIDCCGGEYYGRLYLPNDYRAGLRLPIVFTNYISTPGFYASVGDELPILVFLEYGIAVFALHSRGANIISPAGDFRFEIERVDKPLRAMEWVREELGREGVIDPDRCGLTGVSYGAEIAMYAYWRSHMFRALSVATAGWEPMNYYLAGVTFSRFLDSRGLSLPEGQEYGNWKQLSASLNLHAGMPALLLQSPDQEEYFGNIELWLSLKRHKLPVEWLLYPNEGHVKRSPADRWWVYQRNLDWFRFWLLNEEDPDPTKAEQYKRWRQIKQESSPQPPAHAAP